MKVLMNNASGVKLLTAGKKCLEDIEVVPTFAAAPELGTMTLTGDNMYSDSGAMACVTVYENQEIVQKIFKVTDYAYEEEQTGTRWNEETEEEEEYTYIATIVPEKITIENVVIGSIAIMTNADGSVYSYGSTGVEFLDSSVPDPWNGDWGSRSGTHFLKVTSKISMLYFSEA